MTRPTPTSPAARTLELRLAALERRQALALRLTLAGAAVALLAAFAPDRESVVRGERIELVDSDGRVRAELAIDGDGSAGLFLRAADGGLRASLTHDDGATALYVKDHEGTTRVGIAQFAHGGTGVALHGADARGAAVLYLKDEAGSLSFYDAEGTALWRRPQ